MKQLLAANFEAHEVEEGGEQEVTRGSIPQSLRLIGQLKVTFGDRVRSCDAQQWRDSQ